MTEDFEKLINNDKYQVFVFSSPVSFPINFACHPWFVVNKKGAIARWEVFHFKNKIQKDYNFLHLNTFPFYNGFSIVFPFHKFRWNPVLIGSVEGDDNSTVPKIIEFIENSRSTYPYCNKYRFLPGPNSNTYVQNVLNHFPEFNIKLSSRFIGKDYK